MGEASAGNLLNMSLLARTRHLMARHGLRPVKSLGQNFLIDGNIAQRIASAAVDCGPSCIIEIGPGLGALTRLLADAEVPVIAFEKDRKLKTPLDELLGGLPSVQVRSEDFLKADLSAHLGEGTVACGNLPYYITTPILEKLFLASTPLRAIVVTAQREVVDRIQAAPGSPEYGSLTVFCEYFVECVESVCALRPSVFIPPPSVQSMAVRMTPRRRPPEAVASPEHFFSGLRAAFGYRRKTLKKALATAPQTGLSPADSDAVLAEAAISPQRRGETLSFDEFTALGNALAAWEEAR